MSGIETSFVTDINSITNLIEIPFWQSVERLRNDMPVESAVLIAVEELLKEPRVTESAVYLVSHPGIGLDADSLIKACLGLLERALGRNAQFITPRNVINFLFNLISPQGFSGSFIDPFSGSGSTLREFVFRSKLNNSSIGLVEGIEINSRIGEMSRLFNSLIDPSIKVTTGDSTFTERELCDISISVPPLGIRLNNSIDTPFGQTLNGDLVSIFQIATSLKPNGIAACVVAPGWTWQVSREAVEFRKWLSSNFHVVALISMPMILNVTAIKPVVIVIRNSAPGETIVGTLGEDWLEQSQPQGELYQQIQSSLKP
jgi:type I restriction-modification system DNA methylase subunit